MSTDERARALRWCLILNGKSVDDERVRAAVATMREQGIDLRVRVTWEHGDAARYVDEAVANHVDTVIAAGGDGTAGEIASALAEYSGGRAPSLGLMPLGTANDFATAAQLPDTPEDALALIAQDRAVPVDLLRIDADGAVRWCVNLASGGFGTQVTVQTDDGLKKMLGGLAYLITGIAQLGRIEPTAAVITGPDFHWAGDFIALGVGNGRQAGGGQALCPDASIDDGRLDVTIVPELTGEVGTMVGALLTEGRDAALESVAVRAALPWVEIDCPVPLVLNLDGEPVEARRFRIECVPARITMHLPPAPPRRRRAAAPSVLDADAAAEAPDRAVHSALSRAIDLGGMTL